MQNGVTITTHESELNVIYGMMNLRKERDMAKASVRYIFADLYDIRKNYIRLGFHLYECSKMKYYEDFGYSTMEEFCDKNFDLDKTAVSRCINVCLEFTQKVHYNGPIKNDEYMLEIDDRWSEYSYSQLIEMLPMSEEQRQLVRPEMTIKQIRELKKSLKKKKLEKDSVATSHQDVKYSDAYCKGLNGVVKQQYYKKCKARAQILDIVDSDGKPVEGMYNKLVLVLEETGGHIVIRLPISGDNSVERS